MDWPLGGSDSGTTMQMMQNNGHPPPHSAAHHVASHHVAPPQHAAPLPQHAAPPPLPPHVDPRYMDYATAAAAANMAAPHHHLQDPHALHYASLSPAAAIPVQHAAAAAAAAAAHAGAAVASKRGSDALSGGGYPGSSSDDDGSMDVKPPVATERGAGRGKGHGGAADPATGKKTKGRVKIKMEFIDNKLRRYTTFSKRKTGIMKKVSLSISILNMWLMPNLFKLSDVANIAFLSEKSQPACLHALSESAGLLSVVKHILRPLTTLQDTATAAKKWN